jgi:peptide/nickel transport system substrate-binding protein
MHRPKLWLLLGAAVAALVFAAGGAASQASQQSASAGGTITFGAEQGGGSDWCLNIFLDVDCAEFWNVVFETGVLRGAFILTPQFTYKPDLISGYKLQQNPQRMTLFIRKNAHWSDGVPVTGKDFIFSWKEKLAKGLVNVHTDPTFFQDIKSMTGTGKVVKITMKKPFAAWKDYYFAGEILPEHVLKGTDLSTVWNTCICNPKTGKPIGDGPFLMTSYDPTAGITLTRNPAGWHGKKAKLASIHFVYLHNTNSEIQAMRGGEVDAIYPQPQLALADLKNQSGLKIQSNKGTIVEHLEIELGSKGNPLAKNTWVRQAIATSINRTETVKSLFGTLNPSLVPLNNVMYVPNQGRLYKQHWAKWNYSVSKVNKIMTSHGCSKGGDGFWRCNGVKMSFAFESTAGNALRELAFTFMQKQAQAAGFELVHAFKPAGTLFGTDLPNHNFDIAMFANLFTADPQGRAAIFSCGGAVNYTEYCNHVVTRELTLQASILNPAKRAALFEKIDSQISNDVPWVPLYQKPTYFVYKSSIHGMVDNPNSQGPTWNVETWSRS